MRYERVDRSGAGLHDIWGLRDPTVMAALSLAVVAAFALAFTILAVRTFRRQAVR